MSPWRYNTAASLNSSPVLSSSPSSPNPPSSIYDNPGKSNHHKDDDDGSDPSTTDGGQSDMLDGDDGSSSDADNDGEFDTERRPRTSNSSIEIGVALLVLLLVAAGIFIYFKSHTYKEAALQGNQLSAASGSKVGELEGAQKTTGASTSSFTSSPTTNLGYAAAPTPEPETQTSGVLNNPSLAADSTPLMLQSGNLTSSANITSSENMTASTTPATNASTTNTTNTGPYKLITDCSGTSFWNCWEFFTDSDPTHGQVNFVDQSTASSAGLISATSTSAMMRADNTTDLPSGVNRNSIRLTSKDPVAIGSLMVLDVIAMPWGCSTWPAWWTLGADITWPNGGEIDIIEGVHLNTQDQYTLHVSDSECKQDTSAKTLAGALASNTDCNANNNGNAGCSYLAKSTSSYGKGLNEQGGGVFATLFVPAGISIWYWAHADIPTNILSPDASTWGTPSATWPTATCDISKYFTSQTMVFDLTLCGDWAGNVWNGECASSASTCSEYVKTGSNFDNAVWEIAYVKVYEV